ncbi:hypothetical protein JAAARDRAFT_144101, partial [Jaapia argillacea MUCL 33604]
PNHLPPTVLWTYDDAKLDEDSGMHGRNASHPSMSKSNTLTRKITATPLPSSFKKMGKTRGTYHSAFPKDWEAAILKLETSKPLLVLCADHWKANFLLGSQVANILKGQVDSDLDEELNTKRNRAFSSGSLGAPISKKKKVPSPKMPTTEDSNQFIDVNFIFVNPSINNLIVALAADYPMLTEAFQLLEAIQRAPDFATGLPSPEFTTLVECIEQADPNIPGISKDETNAGWGHQQFKGWKSALPSWNSVGSPLNAQRLVAAIVKTCQVARHLCQHRDITGVLYLGDMYLMNVTEHLWELWKASGGVSS